MSSFFIDRPVLAWVIALLIMIAGGSSISMLPIAQYPEIAPPEISITAKYPGASAKTVTDSVTQIIEQQMSGIDNLNYIYSNSDSSGQTVVTLSFKSGTDVDTALMQVQNKLQLAQTRLPEEVTRQGMRVAKAARNYLMIVGFYSEDGSMSRADIADYVASTILDPVSRVPGAGEATLYGSPYAMRIWCYPESLEKYSLTPSDIVSAVRAQNAQLSAGQIGGAPVPSGQETSFTVEAMSRLETVQDFEKILIKSDVNGSAVFLKDVARIELDSESFGHSVTMNGKPASSIGIRQTTGANALETANAIKARISEMETAFPPGLKVSYTYDSTPFVEVSINNVFKTLVEAIVLVFLVMFLFLQNIRATIIPTLAIPVVLLGTFGVLAVAGFSINTLTMFGMVLAIGLLVDDAIVVVENAERLIRDENLSPVEATKKSMRQITGALFGITLVLAAVFLPMAFFSGSTGAIYRQFSLTIVSSMALSLLVALIFTPALCATILKGHVAQGQQGMFGAFNRFFERVTNGYLKNTARILNRKKRFFAMFLAASGTAAILAWQLPTSFLPPEDMGRMFIRVQLPSGASLERTQAVLRQVESYFMENEADILESIMTVAGSGMGVNGQNVGTGYVRLTDWNERKDKSKSATAVQARVMQRFSGIPEARIYVSTPPPVPELGNSSGFAFEIIDRTGLGHQALMQVRDDFLAKAREHSGLRSVRANGLDDVEQYKLDIDFAKAGALSVSASEISTSIAAYWGGVYVNDFLDKGRTKKVYLQADGHFRQQNDDFYRYYARNSRGEMVPFSAFLQTRSTFGAPRLERFNGMPSVQIVGEGAPGVSSGQAMVILEELAKDLPGGFGYAWSGMSLQEKDSGGQAPFLYALSVAVVFLCLAALYESWTFPISVMLVVPFGLLGSLVGAYAGNLSNDVYFQVGLLTIIGLSTRNAIFIVEFAKALTENGQDMIEATLQAARVRFRPILMTSLAFILGVLPLAISSGAGSGSQNAIGIVVMSGMIAATALGMLYTPLFFVLISSLSGYLNRKKAAIEIGARRKETAH